MNVRLAREEDIPEIARMGRTFWAQTAYAFVPYCEESIAWWCRMMIDQQLLIAIEVHDKPVGFCGALRAPLLGNKRWQVASELFWWIEPEHRNAGVGLALLRAMEDQARSLGVNLMAMMALEAVEPEKATAIYTRAGYAPTERTFTKVLQSWQ